MDSALGMDYKEGTVISTGGCYTRHNFIRSARPSSKKTAIPRYGLKLTRTKFGQAVETKANCMLKMLHWPNGKSILPRSRPTVATPSWLSMVTRAGTRVTLPEDASNLAIVFASLCYRRWVSDSWARIPGGVMLEKLTQIVMGFVLQC